MRTFDGRKLRQARERRGLSIEQLAVGVGVTASAVYKYETGRVVPSGPALGRLADACGCGVDDFYRRAGAIDAA